MNNRFERHGRIPGWKQERLSRATVIITGMGALGNEVARIMAISGVGKLIICDPDVIEESNLSRTVLYRQEDIGALKVDAADLALRALSPNIEIVKRASFLIHGIGLGEIRDANLVIGCLDSHSARLQLAGRCQLVMAKYLDGGTHPWGGEVRPYFNSQGPCYGCSLSPEKRSIVDEPWSCLDHEKDDPEGSAIPSSAIVGAWMGTIALRFLMSLICPEGTLKIDAARGTSVIVKEKKDPDCAMHSPIGTSAKIDVSCKDTFGRLKQALPAGSVALAWTPVQRGLYCTKCRHRETRWGIPSIEICPECGDVYRPRTTVELDDVPESLALETIGIAPREILAVRQKTGLEWIELCEG